MQYVLGVDGGNTKTDYLLFTVEGDMAGHLRAGTCSHEAIGMQGAHDEMERCLHTLLADAGVSKGQVTGAAFGLAGIDQPVQQQELTDIIHAIGFANSIAMNDSFLGIKAGSETGIGISSVNGTGASSGGIDADGKWMQVGGVGYVSGDDGGGNYIASRTLRAVYEAIYRFGQPTALTEKMLALFGAQSPEDFHLLYSTKYQYGDAVAPLSVVQALFEASQQGDAVARAIVEETADALARSAAGCAARLRFEDTIPVVLIGSVWTKGQHRPMMDHFQRQFEMYAAQKSKLHLLTVPPAVGSVLWGLELALGQVPEKALREKVIAQAQGL